MHIGVVTLHLRIEGAESLKDKRHAVRSLAQHLRNKFNVTVAEVGELNLWQRATLGIAVVSNDPRFANRVLSQVVNHAEEDFRVVVDDYTLEMVAIGDGATPASADDEDFSDWFPMGEEPPGNSTG